MAESISSSNNVSLSVLSELKSFLRSGTVKSESADNVDEENKTTESANRDVTRKALSKLSEKKYSSNLQTVRKNTEEEQQNDANTTNPLEVNTSNAEAQDALSINRPDANADFDQLKVNVQSSNAESALKINIQNKEIETKPLSSGIPKQKNAILYELRNTMHLKYSAWDIAKRYGISYLQAQEIFVDLNRDANGVVKEFNLPENSTVSYLV